MQLLLLAIITATLESASDVIDLSGTFSTISGLVGLLLTSGQDAECMAVSASFSGTDVTVVSVVEAGTGSTAWATTISLTVLGSASAI